MRQFEGSVLVSAFAFALGLSPVSLAELCVTKSQDSSSYRG